MSMELQPFCQGRKSTFVRFGTWTLSVVLSRKAVLEDRNAGRKGDTLNQIEEDIIVEGQIKNLTDYGAFVDLGGVDGLLHVTDMSWGRLQNPGDAFKVGDTVQVKVLRFDRARERVSLGYKQLLPDPWETIEERFPLGTRITGKIASVTDYGAFVELEPGVEGLVHVSEMSWSKRVKHPSKIVNPGDTVDVEVLGVDPKARRISLGMKQAQANPWQTLNERYQVGARVQGRVRNLTDFGAFIEIEDGIDGLVHVSDISWSRRIKHPGEILKKGQQVEAIITGIDPENRRMSLSIKDLEPNAWDDFVLSHKPGDVVKGKIARFASFGAFVELGDNLEGLCHISELSDDRVAKPEDAVQLGQEMEFRILRVDAENKKIGLSARAASHEEPIVETKTYTSEAGGGMASLGELADFYPTKSNDESDS
ncbi:MAG: 30S ribosomal protein S1 [Acidobacteria bacterium]|nr:MAG: 30S ribosomal protein S1 [Acidobacteriota bacterium]